MTDLQQLALALAAHSKAAGANGEVRLSFAGVHWRASIDVKPLNRANRIAHGLGADPTLALAALARRLNIPIT